jgi:mannose-6-phosphate isomerase
MIMPNAARLTPSPREKVWGKTHLEPWFPDSVTPIGEVWYLAERELPLLVKLIFTNERLSVQVHPDDGEDGPRGKTEMWHILEATQEATLALGFRQALSRERLREATRTGEIEGLLNWMPARAGQTFFTPAHTVHAIGAGLVLCEIQQNSDVTYRLWDYGRPRPIHVEQAVPIADLGVHPGPARPTRLDQNRDELVRSRHFVTELVRLDAGAQFAPEALTCQLWICLAGQGMIGGEPFRPGEVWLLPDAGEQPSIRATTAARWLRTWVPA